MSELIAAYPWALPLIIFVGRLCDVPLATLRIVFIAKGERRIAPLIGFLEVFIWIIIVAQVLTQANSVWSYLAFAGGYATGTYMGLLFEERIGFGFVIFRVFTVRHGTELAHILNGAGYGATIFRGEGSTTEIDIVEAVIGRRHTSAMEKLIAGFDPKAFYLVQDVRSKRSGIFADKKTRVIKPAK